MNTFDQNKVDAIDNSIDHYVSNFRKQVLGGLEKNNIKLPVRARYTKENGIFVSQKKTIVLNTDIGKVLGIKSDDADFTQDHEFYSADGFKLFDGTNSKLGNGEKNNPNSTWKLQCGNENVFPNMYTPYHQNMSSYIVSETIDFFLKNSETGETVRSEVDVHNTINDCINAHVNFANVQFQEWKQKDNQDQLQLSKKNWQIRVNGNLKPKIKNKYFQVGPSRVYKVTAEIIAGPDERAFFNFKRYENEYENEPDLSYIQTYYPDYSSGLPTKITTVTQDDDNSTYARFYPFTFAGEENFKKLFMLTPDLIKKRVRCANNGTGCIRYDIGTPEGTPEGQCIDNLMIKRVKVKGRTVQSTGMHRDEAYGCEDSVRGSDDKRFRTDFSRLENLRNMLKKDIFLPIYWFRKFLFETLDQGEYGYVNGPLDRSGGHGLGGLHDDIPVIFPTDPLRVIDINNNNCRTNLQKLRIFKDNIIHYNISETNYNKFKGCSSVSTYEAQPVELHNLMVKRDSLQKVWTRYFNLKDSSLSKMFGENGGKLARDDGFPLFYLSKDGFYNPTFDVKEIEKRNLTPILAGDKDTTTKSQFLKTTSTLYFTSGDMFSFTLEVNITMVQHIAAMMKIPASRNHISRFIQYIYIQACRKLFYKSENGSSQTLRNNVDWNTEKFKSEIDTILENKTLMKKFKPRTFKYINNVLKSVRVTLTLSYYPIYNTISTLYKSKGLYLSTRNDLYKGTIFVDFNMIYSQLTKGPTTVFNQSYRNVLDKIKNMVSNNQVFPMFLGMYKFGTTNILNKNDSSLRKINPALSTERDSRNGFKLNSLIYHMVEPNEYMFVYDGDQNRFYYVHNVFHMIDQSFSWESEDKKPKKNSFQKAFESWCGNNYNSATFTQTNTSTTVSSTSTSTPSSFTYNSYLDQFCSLRPMNDPTARVNTNRMQAIRIHQPPELQGKLQLKQLTQLQSKECRDVGIPDSSQDKFNFFNDTLADFYRSSNTNYYDGTDRKDQTRNNWLAKTTPCVNQVCVISNNNLQIKLNNNRIEGDLTIEAFQCDQSESVKGGNTETITNNDDSSDTSS